MKSCLSAAFFGVCMTRDGFQLVSSNLHFSDNEAVPDTPTSPGDALYKVKPALDFLVEKWKEMHSLGE